MSNPPRTCPVCGAPQQDRSSVICTACRCAYAFHTQFSGEKAYALWQAAIQNHKEKIAARLYWDSREAGCTLQVTGNSICFHNPKTNEAVICNFDGSPSTVLKNVRQVALDSLYQLVLHQDGTVSASGDDYYNQKRGLSRITNAAYVAAAPTCAYVVSANGTVTEHGVNDFAGEPTGWQDIQRVAANQLHIVGLKKDGTVVYALSPNSPLRGLAREMDSWANVRDVQVSDKYILALHKNGTVSCISQDPEYYARASQWRNIVAIAADKQYAVGLAHDGNVLLAGVESPFVDYGRKEARQWKKMAFIAAGGSAIIGLTTKGGVQITGTPFKADGCEDTFANSIRALLK